MAQVSSKLTFKCGLRGFHLHGTFWFPIQDEPISFKREFSNQHDRFAVAGQKMFPGKLALDIIDHIPREISRHMWYAMAKGADVTARVINTRPKCSPSIQGGVEILIMVNVEWDNADGIRTLKEKVERRRRRI